MWMWAAMAAVHEASRVALKGSVARWLVPTWIALTWAPGVAPAVIPPRSAVDDDLSTALISLASVGPHNGSRCAELFELAVEGEPLDLGCAVWAAPIEARHGRRPPGHHAVGFADELILGLSHGANTGRGTSGACRIRLRHDPTAPHGAMTHGGHHPDHGHVRLDLSHHRWLFGTVAAAAPGGAVGEHTTLNARLNIADIGAGNPNQSRCTGIQTRSRS